MMLAGVMHIMLLNHQNYQVLYLLQSLEHLPPNSAKIRALNVTSQSETLIKTDEVCPEKSLALSLICVASKELDCRFALQQIDLPIFGTINSKEFDILSIVIVLSFKKCIHL